jgi:hypothetical protein
MWITARYATSAHSYHSSLATTEATWNGITFHYLIQITEHILHLKHFLCFDTWHWKQTASHTEHTSTSITVNEATYFYS